MDYRVVAFYKYVPIENAEEFAMQHLKYCKQLGIGGRIIVADEGINGQLSGTTEQCEQYMNDLKADARFAAVDFKVDEADSPAFKKCHVRYKQEIVNSGMAGHKEVNPAVKTAPHLSGKDFKELKNRDDVVVIDVRSNYETMVGRFKGALTFDMENFREFPGKISELEQFKDKTIVTYCTGGIKCEKASAFLLSKGFENVYQLDGGIIKYAKETGGEDFEGKCYVFDGRIVVDVNDVNPTIISTCVHCGTASARMINCVNENCNDQIIMCESCGWEWQGACSATCREATHERAYDGSGYYSK